LAGKVAELRNILEGDPLATSITYLWDTWYTQKQPWLNQNLELRNYLFATDTSTTSNSALPWKNSTTLPKLTQIRDNLHANYMAALFPNDRWIRWEGYSLDDETQEKSEAIQTYMANKARESGLLETISLAVYDYIDWGNAFGDAIFVSESRTDEATGEVIIGYVGPKAVRISPLDICMNAMAPDFYSAPKITRTIKTIGELELESEQQPDNLFLKDAVAKSKNLRLHASGFSREDFNKAVEYSVDGFGNLQEYYMSPFVEILEIEGDIHDVDSNTLLKDYVVTIIDRAHVIRKEPIPSWLGKGSKVHVGWRLRPDNLYAMGPLDNLVGMQYRIDHLENLKADVFDLIAYPPLKIIGEVEQFDWAPGEEIHIDEGGSDVQMLVPDTTALNADTQIALLEQKMEEFAGAPREAMGIRSPGEKTAFEVSELQNAASRIFQEKITAFERQFLEPLLNSMLEVARRNMDTGDVVRTMDDDLGVVKFIEITKEDITAKGKLRPIGARHFAAQAQLIQNLNGVFNSQIGQMIAPHVSTKRLAQVLEDTLGLQRFEMIQDNIAVFEQMETQRLMSGAEEQLQVEEAALAADENGELPF